MAEPKTRPTTESVEKFVSGIADEQRRKDCFRVLEIMKAVTNVEPAMWGTSIVGFGRYNYKYESGTKGEWFLVGFSPRKQDLTLYLMSGLDRYKDLLTKLGKHKRGRACLYIKKLDDVDLSALKTLIKQSVADIKAMKK
jgi:uncharacterized protein YdhG (YjbR/CyaY superfamily)